MALIRRKEQQFRARMIMLFEYLNLSEDRERDINNLKKNVKRSEYLSKVKSPIPLLIRLYQWHEQIHRNTRLLTEMLFTRHCRCIRSIPFRISRLILEYRISNVSGGRMITLTAKNTFTRTNVRDWLRATPCEWTRAVFSNPDATGYVLFLLRT